MPLVISAQHFEWDTVDHALARVRGDLGLAGIEWSWHASRRRPHCTDADWARLLERPEPDLQQSAHIWEDLAALGRDRGRAALQDWLDLARRTDVRHLVIHGGSSPDQAAGLKATRRVLEAVLPAFEAAGVTLLLENHYAFDYRGAGELFSEPWEFLQVFNLASPSLKFCFDTGHGHMTRNSRALIAELAPWLDYVHLADNHGVDDDHQMYRRGTVDWDGVFNAIRAAGRSPTFCVEFPARDDLEPFRQCRRELEARFA